MNGQSLGAIIIVSALIPLVGFLVTKGIPYNFAFALVLAVFDLLFLAVIKVKLEAIYGKHRAIKMFVYGLGFVSLLLLTLTIFQP